MAAVLALPSGGVVVNVAVSCPGADTPVAAFDRSDSAARRPPVAGGGRRASVVFVLRALRYRNYRLFFVGQIVSLVGTWITTTATSWLVYRLTGSALLLGVVGFAGQFPAFLLGPFSGLFVDRWNRHRLLVATQTISMCQSFALASLTLSGRVTVGWIVGLSVVQGLVNAFDMPGRQAFVIAMIEHKEDLGNAIALNSSMFNAARLVGPSLAGAIIAASSEGWCFAIDGFSYLAVIGALLAMRIARPAPPSRRTTPWHDLREGVAYAFGFAPIRRIITLLALVSLLGMPVSLLMPIFAGDVIGGGPHTLGFLLSSLGFGALAGALWLASRRSVVGLGRVIPSASALFGAGLVAFSFSRSLWLSCLLLVVAGFGFMVQNASSNTVIQTIVDDAKRGRVMSFYMMAFLGAAPFGSLLAGWLSARIGAPRTLAIGGACSVAGAAWFASGLPALRRLVLPIYVRMGILPEVARGLEDAAELSAPPEQR